MRCILILFFIYSCVMPSFSQIYTWNTYTTDNSPLPSNNIYALEQDNNGNLWIGSDSGLTGFNGSVWISYDPSNSNLSDNQIRSVRTDTEMIWLGTDNGLSAGRIYIMDNISWETPYQMANSGLIYNRIKSINIDSLGSLWVGTDSGITVVSDTSWLSFSASSESYLSANKILSINRQATHMQYIGSKNGGVSRLCKDVDGISGASTIWKQWTSFPDSTGRIRGLLSDNVRAILVDKNGDRWYGTDQGLSFHTGAFLKNPYSWISYTMETGLIDNNIQALAEDSSGAIWIGTTGGVSKLIAADTIWTNFTEEDGLISNNVRDIAVTAAETIWLATDAGLSRLTIIPSALGDDIKSQPEAIKVYPAYPNPFNMSTTIKFQIKKNQKVKISIFDITGRRVDTVLSTFLVAGTYQVNWNGKNGSGIDIASGIYFAQISSPDFNTLLKLILLK